VTEHYDEAGREAPEEPLVVRDLRRIDPETGKLRPAHEAPEPPVGSGGPASGPSLGESIVDESVTATTGVEEILTDLERQLSERTADLQRVQAEYANYRKRIERDRVAVVDSAKASVVSDLLPLLDDLERAGRHGDLTGAFKAVGDKLVSSLQRSGLEAFGTEGDPFDPSVHEAVQHNTSPEVAGPTVTVVMRAGYKFGERVLRPALVGVTDHEPGAAPVDAPVEGELPIDISTAPIADENIK
jgi:molecular chaperone GrpE